jgi:hypothetical protein
MGCPQASRGHGQKSPHIPWQNTMGTQKRNQISHAPLAPDCAHLPASASTILLPRMPFTRQQISVDLLATNPALGKQGRSTTDRVTVFIKSSYA